ncbi:MAG: phosphoribosylanthranilate isomerase [Myxococcales bacterium]|nr:phosphoribosylanthranilate isomerase [Myxococcales bacterium]
MARVKICGLTSAAQARACVDLGADAIGINFFAGSKRCVDLATGRAIVETVGDEAITVGVFVDAGLAEIERIKAASGIRCVQLHGDESPELLERFLPHAYKALRVRGAETIAEAARFGGEHVLLDAYVPGEPGGTGEVFEWSLATELARSRQVTLAGGLVPENVAAAVAAVRPFCVDVASGVERAPGDKDLERVAAFIAAAR